ncbi:polysaccharide deacetylase family protein [Chryseomicrobium palamuruense]
MGAQAEAPFEQYDVVYRDKSGEKTIYLTFDNGYENGQTTSILDTLKEHDISFGRWRL